ncbi:SET and MYND domain-containing protein 4 isoform 2-T2 [Polymixia lowei]
MFSSLHLLRQREFRDDLDFLRGLSKGYPVQKDSEHATRCRERGNSSFKTRDYTAATLHYSQGVCFAPTSSEQLSLCYANRSAALYHLQRYQESLDDIDRALKHGYPSHLQHKLQDRRAQCLNHLPKDDQRRKPDHPKPARGDRREPEGGESPNAKPTKDIHNGSDPTVCISPQVAVCFTPEKGRHLVVTEGIAAGESILKDSPYSCVLIPGTQELKGKGKRQEKEREQMFGTEDRRCHRCLGETVCPVPCEGCSYSRYCSTVCRQEAWEEYHRWECPIAADLMATGVMSHLALRVSLKAGLKNVRRARELVGDKMSSLNCPNNDAELASTCSLDTNEALYYGDTYFSIYHLLHHLTRHGPGLRFLCGVTIATLYLTLSQAGPLPASSRDRSGFFVPAGQSQSPEDQGGTAGGSPELCLLGSAVLRHMLQLRSNAQAISVLQDTGVTDIRVQSTREIRVATAIFPTLSLLNHSCCPNTSLAFSTGAGPHSDPSRPARSGPDGSGPGGSADSGEGVPGFCGVAVTVRAAKALRPGQEILHCYGPHSSRMEVRERRRLLQGQYYFLCKCEACNLQQEEGEESEGRWEGPGIGGGPEGGGLQCDKCKGPLKKFKDSGKGFLCLRSPCGRSLSCSEVSHRLQDVGDHLERAADLMERDRPDEALRLLQRTASQSGLILPETHPLQGELADAMARAYATMGDWSRAASQLERSAVAIGSQYGEDSVELGRQLFKLAQLLFNGGARGQALTIIPRVRRLLCLHCGPQCPELNELQAMEECLRG